MYADNEMQKCAAKCCENLVPIKNELDLSHALCLNCKAKLERGD